MNFVIDFILFAFLLVLLYLSFNNGVLKVATVLVGMYAGLQIAGLFYTTFASLTSDGKDADAAVTSQIVWFFALWAVFSIVFSLIAWSFIGTIELPQWMKNFDQLLGLGLGILASLFALVVLGYVFKNTITIMWYGSGRPDNWMAGVKNGFDKSAVISVLNIFKGLFLNVLSPWLPRDVPVFRDAL